MKVRFNLVWIINVLLFFYGLDLNGQGITDFVPIYDRGNLKLELEISEGPLNSQSDCRRNDFKYRLTGQLNPQEEYLIWKIEYQDCNGLNYFKEFSFKIGEQGNNPIIRNPLIIESPDYYYFMAVLFDKASISIRTSPIDNPEEGIIQPQKSVAPDKINGEEKLKFGESVLLSVRGGVLGTNAKWVWYEGQCGDINRKIGEGSSIMYTPENSTIISVRAEGDYNITDCILHPIFVDINSEKPDRIAGPNSSVCQKSEVLFQIIGGDLGYKAQWVWYISPIDEPDKLSKIGFGRSISVVAEVPATIYARAEGENNTTEFVKTDLNVIPLMAESFDLFIDKKAPCEGETITAKLGKPDFIKSSDFDFYVGNINRTDLTLLKRSSNENSLKYNVNKDDYLIRVKCNYQCIDPNLENQKDFKIGVINKLETPTSILIEPTLVQKGEPITLRVYHPTTKEYQYRNSEWYEDANCKTDFKIGSGPRLKIDKIKKETTYSFKAFGECNETNCIKRTIVPRKKTTEIKSRNTIGLGFDYRMFTELNDDYFILDKPIQLHGLSMNLNYEFVKRFNKLISIGANAELNGGITRMVGPAFNALRNWDDVRSSDEELAGEGTFVGSRIGLNFSLMGILISYQNNFVKHNFSTQIDFNQQYNIDPIPIQYDKGNSWESAGIGFRFFNIKGGRTDLQFTLTQYNKITLLKTDDFDTNIYPGISFLYIGNPIVKNSIGLRFNMNITPKNSPVYSGISNMVGSILIDL